MIFSLRKDPAQMLAGRRYLNFSAESGDYFEYEPLEATRRYRDTRLQNLVIDEKSTVIKTDWALDFEPEQYVLLSDENMYMIEATQREPVSAASQAMAVTTCVERDWILVLRRVHNTVGGGRV